MVYGKLETEKDYNTFSSLNENLNAYLLEENKEFKYIMIPKKGNFNEEEKELFNTTYASGKIHFMPKTSTGNQ